MRAGDKASTARFRPVPAGVPFARGVAGYGLIPWNQWARRSFRHIEFFAEAGDVKICWHQDSIPVIQGKELNRITREADGYAQSVKNEYYPLLSQMTEEEGHYLPEVKALFEKNGDGNRL